jgi:hypothetical protein
MTSVRIVQPVVAGGAPRKRGVIIDVSDNEARLLIAARRAEKVDNKPLEVVVTETEEKPKRRGRPKKAKEGASAPSEPIPSEAVDDADSSV